MASISFIIQSKNDLAVIYLRLRDGRKIDLKAKTNFHINQITGIRKNKGQQNEP